jgi:hypothetical protein
VLEWKDSTRLYLGGNRGKYGSTAADKGLSVASQTRNSFYMWRNLLLPVVFPKLQLFGGSDTNLRAMHICGELLSAL